MRPMIRQRERGAALIVALVILIALTLVGVTSMQTTTLQERMAGNLRDRNVAFQAAESALRDAELSVEGIVNPDPAAIGWLYADINPNRYVRGTPEWDAAKAIAVKYEGYKNTVNEQGTYVSEVPWYFAEVSSAGQDTSGKSSVEVTNEAPIGGGDFSVFRITAVGSGGQTRADGNPVSTVVLQSNYRRNGILVPEALPANQ